MYAVIKTGGKQYRVKENDVLKIEKLPIEVGQIIEFDEVLLVGEGDSIEVGTPLVTSKKVEGEVLSHGRRKKIRIIKFKRRKNYDKQMGHRQDYTEVKISKIA